MNSFTHNRLIFWALITRDFKVLKQRLGNLIIDGLILVSVTALVFGNLLPLLGMPKTLIAPIFLGNSLSFFLASLSFNLKAFISLSIQSVYRLFYYITTTQALVIYLFCYLFYDRSNYCYPTACDSRHYFTRQ